MEYEAHEIGAKKYAARKKRYEAERQESEDMRTRREAFKSAWRKSMQGRKAT
jgi:hypothetical protein